MFIAEIFTACPSCPAPVSCNIRSACDQQGKADAEAEIVKLRARVDALQGELNAANGSLIASRELCRQLNATIDRLESARDYKTTQRFHQWQASKPVTRGVSIPLAELEVTEEEGEAFAAMELRITRLENAYLTQHGRITTAHDRLDALREAL